MEESKSDLSEQDQRALNYLALAANVCGRHQSSPVQAPKAPGGMLSCSLACWQRWSPSWSEA